MVTRCCFRGRPRKGFATLVVLALVLCSSVVSAADDCKRVPNILVLFDASGNMNHKGLYKALVDQMNFFTQAVPITADGFFNVGLRHYGLKVGLACDNTESILPVGPWDPDRFMNSFPKTISHGMSSLAAGLRAAADEVAGLDGKSVIIVVGAGIESCKMDPIKITQQIVANNPDVEIHAFQIGGGTEGSFFLRGIAEMGRGTFTPLDDPNTPTLWHAWMRRHLVQPCRAAVQAPAAAPVEKVPPVTFDPNSVSVKSKNRQVDAANQASLQAVAQILKSTPTARVILHGFSVESKGNVKQSLRMSRKRAEAVAHYLTANFGIPPSQIGLVGHGASADNAGRIVEFEIVR
jgi:hypothetical protein